MRAYGATVTTSAKEGILGSRDYADKISRRRLYHVESVCQEDNWKAHYKTTGPEIWNDTHGTVTHFVAAMGTTGTIMGTSTYLKEKNPAIQIIGANQRVVRKFRVSVNGQEYLPKIFDASKVDRIVEVSETGHVP
jgi:cysteine synthase B